MSINTFFQGKVICIFLFARKTNNCFNLYGIADFIDINKQENFQISLKSDTIL